MVDHSSETRSVSLQRNLRFIHDHQHVFEHLKLVYFRHSINTHFRPAYAQFMGKFFLESFIVFFLHYHQSIIFSQLLNINVRYFQQGQNS